MSLKGHFSESYLLVLVFMCQLFFFTFAIEGSLPKPVYIWYILVLQNFFLLILVSFCELWSSSGTKLVYRNVPCIMPINAEHL